MIIKANISSLNESSIQQLVPRASKAKLSTRSSLIGTTKTLTQKRSRKTQKQLITVQAQADFPYLL